MNDKVYVITKGSYSDYHIVAVTLDPVRANKLARLYSDRFSICAVEEYTLNEAKEPQVYRVAFPRGKAPYAKLGEYRFTFDGEDGDIDPHEYDVKYDTRDDFEDEFVVYVSAADEDHALKIAQDRRAEYLAREAGV